MTCRSKVQQSVSLKRLRTDWPRIEADLAAGSAFAVERHGRPVAILLPAPEEQPLADAAAELRGLVARLAALVTASSPNT